MRVLLLSSLVAAATAFSCPAYSRNLITRTTSHPIAQLVRVEKRDDDEDDSDGGDDGDGDADGSGGAVVPQLPARGLYWDRRLRALAWDQGPPAQGTATGTGAQRAAPGRARRTPPTTASRPGPVAHPRPTINLHHIFSRLVSRVGWSVFHPAVGRGSWWP